MAAATAFFLSDRVSFRYCTNRRSIPSRAPLRSPAATLADNMGG